MARSFQARYVAYARAHGCSCEEMLAADRVRWPGGKMAGFMLWVAEQWRAFSEDTGEKPDSGGHWWPAQNELFAAWLEEKTQA